MRMGTVYCRPFFLADFIDEGKKVWYPKYGDNHKLN